jgi:hypothetical protein
MSITLSDGVTTLPLNHVLWVNRSSDRAAGNERRTLGGRLVIQRLVGRSVQDIVLEARLESGRMYGWFLGAQIPQLEAWRDAGTPLTLNYDGEIRAGIIPLGGIDIEPVFLHSTTIDPAARCAGTLTIKER